MSLIKEALDKALETDREQEPTASERYEELEDRTDASESERTETPTPSDDTPDGRSSSNQTVMFLIMGVLGFVLVVQLLVLWLYVL